MLPFVSIGRFTFASYGIMMATGLLLAYYLLRADLKRRQLDIKPQVVLLSIGLFGLLASKLFLAIENPRRFLADPAFLLSRSGYTFYGAVIGGAGVVFILARLYRISSLRLFDAVSAEAAIGYGIGRLGCLLAGDGDYGTPTSMPWGMSFPHGLVPTTVRVHPTPIYEFIASAMLAIYLWKLGAPAAPNRAPPGQVFAQYLILSGVARFLVEIIRLNPPVLWGLTNAQCIAVISVTAGTVLANRSRAGAPELPSTP